MAFKLGSSNRGFNIPENKKEDTIFAKRPEQLSVSDFIYLTNLVGNENIWTLKRNYPRN